MLRLSLREAGRGWRVSRGRQFTRGRRRRTKAHLGGAMVEGRGGRPPANWPLKRVFY